MDFNDYEWGVTQLKNDAEKHLASVVIAVVDTDHYAYDGPKDADVLFEFLQSLGFDEDYRIHVASINAPAGVYEPAQTIPCVLFMRENP